MNKKIFHQLVNKFTRARDSQDNRLKIHSPLISIKGNTFLHNFNNRQDLSDITSISKTED